MPRFQVTVQSILDANRSGPHFSVQLDASSYSDALVSTVPHLERMLAESGLAIVPVATVAVRPPTEELPKPGA